MKTSVLLATLASATMVFGQFSFDQPYQIGYAANLNVGDSVVNMTNSGVQGGFASLSSHGNICVNVYTFDPQEEEIACCSCVVTPNALVSLSVRNDLISNLLTPSVPNSVVIKLVSSEPGLDPTKRYTLCNPSTVGGTNPLFANVPYDSPGDPGPGSLTIGLRAWGSTLEPAAGGAYAPVGVGFLTAEFLTNTTMGGAFTEELTQLASTCQFIQANGSGYGTCKTCRLGALSGSRN